MAEFARGQGCNEQRLRYWRERVEAQAAPSAQGEQKLLPGVIVNVAAAGGICVTLPRGVVVEARAVGELEPAWLVAVVRALETAP